MKTLLKIWSQIDEVVQKIERSILVLGMMTILVTGVMDIALRLFFGWGLGFADTLARQITVWLGLFGAALATSHAEHINIDAFSRILKRRGLQLNRIAIGVACILMSGALTYYAIKLVQFYIGNATSLVPLGSVKIPTWLLLLAFPVSFGIMTSRYILHTFEYIYASLGDPLPWSLVTQQMEEELTRREQPESTEETASQSAQEKHEGGEV